MSKGPWLAPDVTPQERSAFGDLDVAIALPGERVNENAMSCLRRCRIGDKHYYVKVYFRRGRYLRRYLGRSRIRAEWENQRHFVAWDIPTSRLVAFAEQRQDGAYRGIVVTEEVPGTIDLWTLVKKHPEKLAETAWLRRVIDRLAGHVRTMHNRRFVHNDLKWRNILVDFSNTTEVYIIDCPLGRVCSGPIYERGVAKDLACVDRGAWKYISRSMRLRFALRYYGADRLSEAQKKRVRRVLGFFEGRD